MQRRQTRLAALTAAAVLPLAACGQESGQTDGPTAAPQTEADGNGVTETEQQDPTAPPSAAASLHPPDDEIGADVPLDPVLVEQEQVVVALTGMTVYSTGAQVRVAVRRHPDSGPGQVEAGGPLGSPGRPGAGADGEPSDELLRIAFVYPDGQVASSLDQRTDDSELREGPQLSRSLGSGTEYAFDYQMWLRPLPRQQDGGLRMQVEWPAEGIDTTRQVDLAEVDAAADRTVTLWEQD